MDIDIPGGTDHQAWRTVVGVGLGYGAILAVIFVALFLLPYLAFTALT